MLATASLAVAGPARAADDKPGSLYVQCDGEPNNVTAGETAARLLGAVTLLGLFAPPAEMGDVTKRRRGADGVAACTPLIEGERAEGNVQRRIDLILARAVHRIEAKDYDGAVADAKLAREQAAAAGLMADPYFARSRGLAFDWVESAALFRKGDAAAAREAALRATPRLRHAPAPLLSAPDYAVWNKDLSDVEASYLTFRTRALPFAGAEQAARLEEMGRFAEAARVREAVVELDRTASAEFVASIPIAQAAVAHALAGNATTATTLAAEARANAEKRRAAGKADKDPAALVELLDLHAILDAAGKGDLKTARRLFAARSQWIAPSFGSVLETNKRLRTGAASDELIGGLAKTPDELWKDRADADRAAMLAKDDDNRSLFALLPRPATAAQYEAVAKTVWRTDKSRIILARKEKDPAKTAFETMFLYGQSPFVALEAYTLHAALIARSRGHGGFVMLPLVTSGIVAARFMTGDRGAPGLHEAVFNDAAEVIEDLSPVIPSPEELKARTAARSKSKTS